MALNKLASIATIVEAVFVVISVYFIWRELHENTKITKVANTKSLVELSSPFNMQLIQDRTMAELWVYGAKKFAEMDEVDKYRYKSLLIWWLILHENIYFQHKNRLLDSNVYKAWRNDLENFVKTKNLWQHWDEMKDVYHPGFADQVTQLIEKQKRAGTPDNGAKA